MGNRMWNKSGSRAAIRRQMGGTARVRHRRLTAARPHLSPNGEPVVEKIGQSGRHSATNGGVTARFRHRRLTAARPHLSPNGEPVVEKIGQSDRHSATNGGLRL